VGAHLPAAGAFSVVIATLADLKGLRQLNFWNLRCQRAAKR